ncbi:MAG TPA: short-chain dehydrogenase [Deltaproteobacteria bacterium]|nr:short-chain dehydrogenase [Deltaproteobacteria bacterium]
MQAMARSQGRFDGKVAFVTGGGTGIGLACAQAIVDEGGSVMLAGRREGVLRVAAQKLGSRAAWVVCDVASDGAVEHAVSAAVDQLGPLRLAVNSAGAGSVGSVLNGTSDDFSRTIDTNLVGAFRAMRAEARAMKAAGGGSIVNVSSIAGVLTHRWMSAYCASKAGLNMLTRCAADDLGEHGIRVNAVMPSFVPTEIWSVMVSSPEIHAEYLRRIPLGRLGTVEDVAALTAFLLSDASGWITGQCMGVDGGHTIRQGPDMVPIYRQFLPEER